jgi:hypothetical protein
MLSPKQFQELYISMYEARDDDAKEMRRLAAAERRAGNSDRMDAKTASKYAGSEAKSAEREDKKSKGKHIHGYAIGESAVGDRARNAVADQRIDDAQRDAQSSVDKLGKREKVTRAGAHIAAKKAEATARNMHPKPGTTGAYRTESAVPGKPAEKLGAVSSIPKDEQDAARQRTLAKAAAMRAKKGITKEEVEVVDEGMTMKDFKAQRSKVKRSENRAADKIAPGRRAGIHNPSASPERAARHRANVDPDFEGNDERNYPGGSLKSKKVRKARAVGELTKEQLELELRAHLRERALDASEKKEKESVYKAIKPSKLAKSYPEKSPKELKSLRYAISTNQAKKNMDTSRSDKRYGVEG